MQSTQVVEADFIGESDKSNYTPLKVLRSAAGFYVGTEYKDPKTGFVEPGSRDSGYFRTAALAEAELRDILRGRAPTRTHPAQKDEPFAITFGPQG